ncbi:MAG: hypothetical protein KatS3mg129_2226 [Leptospiraceae bacterium]|nr:MAG: hypothetical protein KatS3mg129_2226 [Leptospiraceae bacterium]
MKFLVTGNIRSNQGPRNVIVFAYVFFLLFIISNFYLHFINTSFSYKEFLKLIEPSFTLRLEELHINLFLFGMYFLFTLAMLYQTKFSLKKKNLLFLITLIYFICYLFSLIFYSQSLWFFYFYHFSVFGFHIYLIFYQFILIRDIFLKNNEK